MNEQEQHNDKAKKSKEQPEPTPPPGIDVHQDHSKAETRPFARTPKWIEAESERIRDKSETRPMAGISPEQLSQKLPHTEPPPAKDMPPPPLLHPPKTKRKRSGCVTVMAVLGGIFLLFILLLIIFMYRTGSRGTYRTPRMQEEVLVTGSGDRKIAVIDIKGVIIYEAGPFDAASARLIIEQLKHAQNDPHVAAVILDMNTPGGEVTASDEIHHAVTKLSLAGKPVITCMHALGASGGYFVAAGSDYIIANRLTMTGSIGVIAGTLNYAGFFEKHGFESEIYASGDLKAFLHGGSDRTAEEKELINNLVRQNYEEFIKIVAAGRAAYETPEAVLEAPFADGRVLTGAEALEHKLIDQLGYFQDSIRKARELAGVLDAPVVRYRLPRRLTDLLFSMQQSRHIALQNLLPSTWRHLQPGCLYYLLPAAIP